MVEEQSCEDQNAERWRGIIMRFIVYRSDFPVKFFPVIQIEMVKSGIDVEIY